MKKKVKCRKLRHAKCRKKKCRKKMIYKIYCIKKRAHIICPKLPLFSIKPEVNRYFFITTHDLVFTGENLVLLPNQFVDDRGEPVTEFKDFGQEGYFNLYVNGVLQEGNLYEVTSDALSIKATGQIIYKGTPIILESIGFVITQKK